MQRLDIIFSSKSWAYECVTYSSILKEFFLLIFVYIRNYDFLIDAQGF